MLTNMQVHPQVSGLPGIKGFSADMEYGALGAMQLPALEWSSCLSLTPSSASRFSHCPLSFTSVLDALDFRSRLQLAAKNRAVATKP
jgi:hypothetical protein